MVNYSNPCSGCLAYYVDLVVYSTIYLTVVDGQGYRGELRYAEEEEAVELQERE